MRKGAGEARAPVEKQELERHKGEGEGEEGRQHQERTQASHVRVKLLAVLERQAEQLKPVADEPEAELAGDALL
jgi:hypothetical protein